MTGTYRLYPSSPLNAEAIHFDFIDFDLDDDPKPITAANGFSTVRPGESITRDLTMVPICFEAKPGAKYVLRMPEGYGFIQWWGVGEMEAFKGVEVRCTEWSEDGGLEVGMSNEIEVLAVTPDSHSSSGFFQ